jgi:hypothetical protein
LSNLFPNSPEAYSHLAEYEVAQQLANVLPANWHILSNIEWSARGVAGRRTGEIDFIVLTPDYRIHVIELTFGFLEYDGTGSIVIASPFNKKNKSTQLKNNKAVVIEILREATRRGADVPRHFITGWLLAPRANLSHEIPNPAYPFENVIDAKSASPVEELAARIIRSSGVIDPNLSVDTTVLKIFKQELKYYLDPSTLTEGERKYVTSFMSTSELLLSIKSDSNRFIVDGVAGSGKTQLAIAGLERARSKKIRAALISNTKVLPTLLKSEYGNNFPAFTYFSFKEEPINSYDEVYVEEAHHFEPAAIEGITARVKTGGRMFYLMDSHQNFDGRFIAPPDAVTIYLSDTYRVPHEIVRYLNLFLSDRQVRCKSPQINSEITFDDSSSTDDETFLRAIDSIELFLSRNLDLRSHCGVVYCGNQFQLASLVEKYLDRLKSKSLIRSDLRSEAIIEKLKLDSLDRAEDITLDTIRRFQGSSNKFIWICGLTKQSTIDGAVRLFYSAVTRARARCEVFCTSEFASQLAKAIT